MRASLPFLPPCVGAESFSTWLFASVVDNTGFLRAEVPGGLAL